MSDQSESLPPLPPQGHSSIAPYKGSFLLRIHEEGMVHSTLWSTREEAEDFMLWSMDPDGLQNERAAHFLLCSIVNAAIVTDDGYELAGTTVHEAMQIMANTLKHSQTHDQQHS